MLPNGGTLPIVHAWSFPICQFLLAPRRLKTHFSVSLVLALAHAALMVSPTFLLGTSDDGASHPNSSPVPTMTWPGNLSDIFTASSRRGAFPSSTRRTCRRPTARASSGRMRCQSSCCRARSSYTDRRQVNLLGVYALACFVLPGPFVTWVLAVAGQRHLLAAMVGTAFAVTMPILYWRWGDLRAAPFLIPGALALYLCALAHARSATLHRTVGGLSGPDPIIQQLSACHGGRCSLPRLCSAGKTKSMTPRRHTDGGVVGATVWVFMNVDGFIGGAIRQLASFGFGYFSMNLLGLSIRRTAACS